MSVAAVVVSFNRLDYLKKCLRALEAQTRPLDEIIVIENGSTDGSAEYVTQNHPGITLFETGANLGGAGGFAWGIELALQKGHSFAWLMDDDAEPRPAALAPLLDVMESDSPPAFAAPLVRDQNGAVVPGNLPPVSTNAASQLRAQRLGGTAISHTTFVGALIDLKLAAATTLPYADFFIWFDDVEYTQRLARSSFGILLMSSEIQHPNNVAVVDMGWRLYYFLRNSLWLTRLGRPTKVMAYKPVVRFVGLAILAARQFPVAKSKKTWLSGTFRGLYAGMFTLPRPLEPGELWNGLGPERRSSLTSRL